MMTKQEIQDALGVDDADAILWNYEPRNYKFGDEIICIDGMKNNYVNEDVILGEHYIVGFYDKGNIYKKGYLQIKGCRVLWNDDRFELVSQNKTEDVEFIDLTNQNKLNG